MRTFIFLLGLGLIVSGCKTTPATSNIPQNYVFKKNGRSIIIGKVKFENIEGDFKEGALAFVNEQTDKVYPIKLGLPTRQTPAFNGKVLAEYYYFIELPAGQYSIGEVAATHGKFSPFEIHLLNANLTIGQNSIVYVGTIRVHGVGKSLEHIGPITEDEIINEQNDVIKAFKSEYPQFQDTKVSVKVIDRYKWFRDDHIETDFEKY